MPANMVRLGLLSTARINREILAAAASGRVEVVAVASREEARARAFARDHGVPKAYPSYEELLAAHDVDAVYVPLPNGLHHEWTMRALEAGKHVLAEKPYSRHPADVEQAFDAASARGLVLMEAFMYRHHPQTAIVSDLVARGEVGRLRAIHAAFSFKLQNPGDPRLDPALDGGALMDVGCYCVSGSRLLAGEPVHVHGEQVVGDAGVDLAFHGTLRFRDDVVAQIDASFERPRFQRLEVLGEEGSLLVESPWRADWDGDVLLERDGEVGRVEIPRTNPFEQELENFADAVGGEAPQLLGREDALGQARTIDALYRSAQSGIAISLEAG
jgi:D-xylose 1-dehydrogenase (NADP+, D-xylono-1,5-lactone-forming)